MTPTTQTNPHDRCEQIAREIADRLLVCHSRKIWKGLGAGGLGSVKVRDLIVEAFLPVIQAAEQRGREEERKLDTICHAVKAEQQPKSEPSQECAKRIVRKWADDPEAQVRVSGYKNEIVEIISSALQAKQDELNALREEVLGVIEPFAAISGEDKESWAGSTRLTVNLGHCRSALALRDKLKASQPTLPQPQTPHQ